MASTRGYVLFSQTSRPFGTRDLWGPAGLPGGTAGPVAGLVNGDVAAVPLSAFDAFAGADVRRPDWALLALGPTADAAVAGGRAFDAPPGPRNPDATLALDPDGAIVVALADADWNGIKNVEILLTSDDDAPVRTRNIVDVRIKIGGGDSAFDPQGGAPSIDIGNAKRGEIDARESPGALTAAVSLTSNGPGWGNSFAVFGSGQDDELSIRQGDWSAPATTLDGFRDLVNDGRHSMVLASLGAGNDRFDAGSFSPSFGETVAATRARTDITMGPDAGTVRPWLEGFAPQPGQVDPQAFQIWSTREIILWFGPVDDAAGATLAPAFDLTVTFLNNGTIVTTRELDAPRVAADISPGYPGVPVSFALETFFDEVRIAGGPGNEAALVTYWSEGIYSLGFDSPGDRAVCGDGVDVIRYASGDGVDIVERFDASRDRIVLEGISRANVAAIDNLSDSLSGLDLGYGTLLLTDLGALPPPEAGYPSPLAGHVIDAAIFLPGTSAAAVEAALIFA